MKANLLFAACILWAAASQAQQPVDTLLLDSLLHARADLFANILADPNKKQVQILYTQINRDRRGRPYFKSFGYRLSNSHYFYPASTVKLPTAIFALEKINALNIPGLTRDATMLTDSAWHKQTPVDADPTAASGLPSIGHYIKKILLVSDNDAFNRLFEFVGRAEVNEKLRKHGLHSSRILNRLSVGDGGEYARHTNPVRFLDKKMRPVYSQPAQYDPKDYPLTLTNTVMGKGYYDSADQLVMQPFDMGNRNTFPLADQQEVMKKLMFPEVYPKKERFLLTPADRILLYHFMSSYPYQASFPRYDTAEFFTTYGKFLFYGAEKNTVPEPYIHIYNKIGDSYGFMIDNMYFVDAKNKVEFLLAAVVQSNDDGIYNDDKYEYQTVCLPFLKNLGQVIYQYELQREKKWLPKVSYEVKTSDRPHEGVKGW